MNRNVDNYSLLSLATNAGSLRAIFDSANAKYNRSTWRGFTEVLAPVVNKNFTTILDEVGISVKASILGGTDKKPLRGVTGAEMYTDSMVKIGHGFKVDQSDINYIKSLNQVNTNLGNEILKKYRNRAAGVIGGFHATWNDWVFEALSDQQITLSSQGQQKDIYDLRVPSKMKLKAMGSKPWFDASGDGYDILGDLRRMCKVADDAGMPDDRVFVCSKELFDKMFLDKNFLNVLYLTAGVEPGASPSPTEMAAKMARAFGIPPVIPIDEKSMHEVDGIPVLSQPSFNTNKISLIQASRIFDLHNSPSDYADDTNPATVKNFIEGGLIGTLTTYGSEPMEIVTNMESWSMLALKNPKTSIVGLDTSKFSASGK